MTPSKGPLPCSTPVRRALPQQIRFIDAESAASYIGRLATANGLEYTELLHLVGRGVKVLPAPGSAELYLNAKALDRLSVLSGQPVDRLQRALPATRPEHALPSRHRYSAWRWFPSEGGRQSLVRACRLCAAARNIEQVAFVWSDLPWQVCLRHGTWQDGRPEQHAWTPPADALEWILQTHRRRVAFEQRFGRMGRPLFADAYIAVLAWYQQGWVSPGWFARQRSLRGIDSTSLPSVVTYPETVELAHLLGRYERQRRTGTLDEPRWMRQLAETLARWSAPSGWHLRPGANPPRGSNPMDAWLAQHNPSRTPGRRLFMISVVPGRWTQLHRHRRLRLKKPHEYVDRLLPLERVACLPHASVDFQHQSPPAPQRGLPQPQGRAGSIPERLLVPSTGEVVLRSAPPPRGESGSTSTGRHTRRVEMHSPRQSSSSGRQESQSAGDQRHDSSLDTDTTQQPEPPVAATPKSQGALNLRFPDPQQHAAIAAAAKRQGVSMQDFILSAAYARATTAERKFLAAFRTSMSHSGAAFTSEADDDRR